VEGLQSVGVAATAKHFPGHGDTSTDSHYAVPVINHSADLLHQVDLPPFQDAVRSGVKLVMTAHVALPAVNGGANLPATLSPAVLKGLLRNELGFNGLIATDALDMLAIQQGAGLTIDAITAVAAGVDLLLFNHEPGEIASTYQGLLQAARRGLLDPSELFASSQKMLDLKDWLAHFDQPALSVVGCRDHRKLALETALQAQTLVRDQAGLLPLKLPSNARLAAVMPAPTDLTPADTSSTVIPTLAAALRRCHPTVEEILIPLNPSKLDVAAYIEKLSSFDLVVMGTINAREYPGQAALVNGLLERDIPLVAVAMRVPYDLSAYPAAPTYICTYSILVPSMEALVSGLWGQASFPGKLPVTLPDV
jgi:beta-N-acetylhexosaminidase